MSKERKQREARYTTEDDMKQHFTQHINKCVEIIDRQLVKMGKTAKGRTFKYNASQVEKLYSHLLEQLDKTKARMNRKIETIDSFDVGE